MGGVIGERGRGAGWRGLVVKSCRSSSARRWFREAEGEAAYFADNQGILWFHSVFGGAIDFLCWGRERRYLWYIAMISSFSPSLQWRSLSSNLVFVLRGDDNVVRWS